MEFIEYLIKFIETSGISKAYALDPQIFLTLVFGSIFLGYICLTFYYNLSAKNKKSWRDLNKSEKVLFSLLIGFTSIFISYYAFSIFTFAKFQLGFTNNKYLEQTFEQLKYILPFIYFIFISVNINKSTHKKLDFVKEYFIRSYYAFFSLTFIAILLILHDDWKGVLLTVLLFLLMILFIKRSYIYQKLWKINISS